LLDPLQPVGQAEQRNAGARLPALRARSRAHTRAQRPVRAATSREAPLAGGRRGKERATSAAATGSGGPQAPLTRT